MNTARTLTPATALVPVQQPAEMPPHGARKRTPKYRPHIEPRWLDVQAIHEFFGGILSYTEIETLLKDGHIPARWKRGRLSARVQDVEQWEQDIARAKDPQTTARLGADYIVPVAYILSSETKRGAR